MSDKYQDINAMLNGLFQEDLRQLFDKRLHELNTTQTAVEKMLGLQYRTLNGVLDGEQKRVNYPALNKLAAFLNMPLEKLIELNMAQLSKKINLSAHSINKKKFLREKFDLGALKKAGFITDINDTEEICAKLEAFLGLNSIFDYKRPVLDVAYMAGAITPENTASRDLWKSVADAAVSKLDNPYYYDRQELIKYFPHIRWQTTNIDSGLTNVVKALYKLGITVVFIPHMPAVNLRGATFTSNGQPCIALTDYRGFYGTLWHGLVHELYHVLFDWSEDAGYQITDDTGDTLSNDPNEAEANDFAQKFLFSKDKLEEVTPYLSDHIYIKEVAADNNIEPSIIYLYHAWFNGKVDRMAWPRVRRYNPKPERAYSKMQIPFGSLSESINKLKIEIYN